MTHLNRAARLGTLALLVGLLTAPLPAAAQEADPAFAAFAGGWSHHGFGLTVYDDGSGVAIWRVYRWCGPGVPEPCDLLTDNRIISGGHADLTFTGIDEAGALQGEVSSATDTELLADGPLSLTSQPYGMLLLEQGDTQLTLCGDQFTNLAPPEVVEQSPCGA